MIVLRGMDFLGYIVRPRYRLVRHRVIDNLRQKLFHFQRKLLVPADRNTLVLQLRRKPREQLRAVLASYLGHFRHGGSYNLVQRLNDAFPWLQLLFDLSQAPERLYPRWEPGRVSGYRSQLHFFRQQFPNAVIHVQRGPEVDTLLPKQARVADAGNPVVCQRVEHVVVREAGYLPGGLKRRLITRIRPVII